MEEQGYQLARQALRAAAAECAEAATALEQACRRPPAVPPPTPRRWRQGAYSWPGPWGLGQLYWHGERCAGEPCAGLCGGTAVPLTDLAAGFGPLEGMARRPLREAAALVRRLDATAAWCRARAAGVERHRAERARQQARLQRYLAARATAGALAP